MSTPTTRMAIMAILEANPDGLTARQISEKLGRSESNVIKSIELDERAYIDRWTESPNKPQWIAVWCLQPPLVNAPKPTMSPRKYRQALEVAHV